MWMHIRNLAGLIAACTLPFAVSAQQNTIPERVAASNGRPVVILLARDLEPVPLADLVAGADLIVYGKLVRQRSYLTEAKPMYIRSTRSSIPEANRR
jgi:hypothetical protein